MSAERPDFLQPVAATPVDRRRWWSALALLGLIVLLGLQMLLADRDRLAQSARWRPWVSQVCAVLGCELPLWHQPEAFRLSGRDIQPHPSVPGALMVRASFQNTAAYPQAWPIIELSMSDIEDRRMGLRRFRAADYLGGTPATATMAPGQAANLTLEVMDPGKRAVAFSFEFY